MSLDGQLEKLGALYAEKSDGELLDLYEQREGLTAMAQQALAGVMRERRLAANTVGTSHAVADTPTGESAEDSLAEDEVPAYLFKDAFEAREAIRVMTEAEIPHRILDWHVVNPQMKISQTGLDLGLVVTRPNVQRTVAVLKQKLGLFPEPEKLSGDAQEHDAFSDALMVLSMFDRREALIAAQALGEVGMTYLWRDGRDHAGELPDEETVAIEVQAADVERATAVVEDALAKQAG
jgi:hypothetical protein